MEYASNNKDIELLDKYLDGILTDTEKTELERRLRDDENLQSNLKVLQTARDAVISYNIREKVKKAYSAYKKNSENDREITAFIPRNRKILWWTISIAASLLVLFVTYLSLQNIALNNDNLYADNFISYELPITRSVSEEFTVIDSLYFVKDYALAIQQFETGIDRSSRGYFLTAMSHMYLGDFKNATKLFEIIKMKNNQNPNESLFEQETDYYLALAYLKLEEYAKSRELFYKILGNKRHLYHRNVTPDLIKKVQRLEKNK